MSFQENWNKFRINLSKRIHPKKIGDRYLATVGYGGASFGSGVTPMNSMQSTAVFGCYRVITESVASLPLILYKRLEQGKERAYRHPLYNLFRYEPNPEMTAYQWVETSVGHMMLWGNAYSEIEINGKGEVIALYPIQPEKVVTERNKESKLIQYKVYERSGGFRIVPAWKMFHLPFMTMNGITGISPIGLARRSIGLAVSAEEYGAAFFENGATPKIILEYPGALSPEAQKNLKASWNEANQGAGKAHNVQILEEGMKADTLSIPPNDAQFLETRKFQLEDIARIFRVPPHMVGDLDKATFSNIEQQSLDFIQHSLRTWIVRFEQEIHRQLLLKTEKKDYFTEFLVDGLLRGDITSRYAAYAVGKQWGWLSANDIREKENLNPIEGGDAYWQPLNMMTVGEEYEDPTNEEEPRNARMLQAPEKRTNTKAVAARRRATLAWRRILQDSSSRIIKKEVADLRKIFKDSMKERSLQDFQNQIDAYYDQRFEQYAYQRMAGTMQSYGEEIAGIAADEVNQEREDVMDDDYQAMWIKRYTNAYIARHIAESKDQLNTASDLENGSEEKVTEALDRWEEKRAVEEGKEESVRLNGAISRKVWALAGVLSMKWVCYGDTCAYCKSLNGTVVGINENFLTAGVAYTVDDADVIPLVPRQSKMHPPAHGGCDCSITAVI